MVYGSTLLVVTVRACPVASFLAVTLALGTTAPLGSVTVPEIDEVSDCASARVPVTANGTTGNSAAANRRALPVKRKVDMRGSLRNTSCACCVSSFVQNV